MSREPLTYRVTAEEARELRAFVAGGPEPTSERLWAPIQLVTRENARARCRYCEQPIVEGDQAIMFAADFLGNREQWGRLFTAYLHAEPCGEPAPQPEEEP